MSAKAKATTVEWSDESCHLSKKQMKAMGFGSTQEMMEHYYDCKPSDTKHEMLNKSVKAMRCVLGRIARMLQTPVKPNAAKYGLFDKERDAHLYQIVLAFLYGKKCLKNALINLEDSQLDAILGIYTSLVNDAFNKVKINPNPRIRNLKPVEEEGPEGVYHQLHEGRFSIDHLIEHLRKQKFPDVRNPRKLVDDPVINGILNSMDRLVSNPEITIEDPRITGNMLYHAFERVTRNFHEFRARSTGEVLRYKDEVWAEPENEELVRALAASSLAKAPVAEGGAGSGGPAKTVAVAPHAEGGAGSGKKGKLTIKKEENLNAILSNFRADTGAAKPTAAAAAVPPAVANPTTINPIDIDKMVHNIILDTMRHTRIQNIDPSSLPKEKGGLPIVNYEFKIMFDPEPQLNIKLTRIVKSSDTKTRGVFRGLTNSYYYSMLSKLKTGNHAIDVFNDTDIQALLAVAKPPSHGGGRITRKRLRRSNATRKIRKF